MTVVDDIPQETHEGRYKLMAHFALPDDVKENIRDHGIEPDTLWFAVREYNNPMDAQMDFTMISIRNDDPSLTIKLIDVEQVLTVA